MAGLSLSLTLLVTVAGAGPLDNANRLYVHEKYNDALNAYRAVAESTATVNDGSRAEALYLVGRCLQDLNRWKDAIDTYNELVERFPNSRWRHFGYLRTGDCYAELSDWGNAVSNYSNSVTIGAPTEVQVLGRFNRAAIYANGSNNISNVEQAESDLHFVTTNDEDPDVLAQAYFTQGELNRGNANWTEALKYYEKAATLAGDGIWGAMSRNVIAGINLQQGNRDVAVEQLKKITEDHRNPPALNQVAQLQLSGIEQKDRGTALQVQALKLEDSGDTVNYRGNVVIHLADAVIRCDEATLKRESGVLECRKNVTLQSDSNWSLTTNRFRIDVSRYPLK